MFTLRGWLLAIVGGLLAAYYTENIGMSELLLRIALVAIVLLFLVVESRHVNLFEAAVERATAIERQIVESRQPGNLGAGWYDGPKVGQACLDGARRWWPRRGMTFLLNQPFYLVVILIVVVTTLSLPSRPASEPSAATPAPSAPK